MIEPVRKTHTLSLDKNGKYIYDAKSPSADAWRFEIDRYEAGGVVNENSIVSNVGKGWVPHGGIVLKNVFHGKYRMAYEVGVVGIVVTPGRRSKENTHVNPKYLVLGPPDFVQVDNNGVDLSSTTDFDPLVPKPNAIDSGLPGNFNVYNIDQECALKVRWRSNFKLFGDESDYLWVTQKIVLTKYDNNPAHEPTGGLMAARVHPLIELEYKQALGEWVESFRVDYRMYWNLNAWWSRKPAGTKWTVDYGILREVPKYTDVGRKTTEGKLNNAAGVFSDNVVPDLKAAPANVLVGQKSKNAFYAAEKPLLAEILTSGYNEPGVKTAWDNVHWWGAGENWTPGSAPGSFHALHMHWKWAYVGAQRKLPEEIPNPLNVPHMGAKQFGGAGYGGVLVDSAISKQIIRIAIVANDGIPADPRLQLKEKFETFIQGLRKSPKDIRNGDEIVLYYSVEIPVPIRSRTESVNQDPVLKGTTCIHGFYFAHEDEKEGGTFDITGELGRFYQNPAKPDASKLKRYPV